MASPSKIITVLRFGALGARVTWTFGSPWVRKHRAYEFIAAKFGEDARFGEELTPEPAGCEPPLHAATSASTAAATASGPAREHAACLGWVLAEPSRMALSTLTVGPVNP